MQTLGNFRLSSDPRAAPGFVAAVGQLGTDIATGVAYLKMGTGDVDWVPAAHALRPLKTQTTSGVSLGSTETTLHTFDLPANLFSSLRIGDCIDVEYGIITAANANSKRPRIYFGSAVLYDGTAQAVNNGLAIFRMRVYQTSSANSQRGYVTQHGSSLWVPAVLDTTLAQTTTATITVKLTGQGVADNDLVCRMSSVRFVPGNALGA